jgi:hypothetical protein
MDGHSYQDGGHLHIEEAEPLSKPWICALRIIVFVVFFGIPFALGWLARGWL